MDWLDELACWRTFLNYLDPITRTWGFFTSIVLFGVGADLCTMFENHQLAGGFAIAAGLITLFLEMTWAITIVLQVTLRNENHPVFECWDAVLWFDMWKRSLLYTLLAVLLFADPHRPWFTVVSGLMLIALSTFHAIRWFRDLRNVQVSLLEQQDFGYDDVEVDLSLNEPVQHADRNPVEQAELSLSGIGKDAVPIVA